MSSISPIQTTPPKGGYQQSKVSLQSEVRDNNQTANIVSSISPESVLPSALNSGLSMLTTVAGAVRAFILPRNALFLMSALATIGRSAGENCTLPGTGDNFFSSLDRCGDGANGIQTTCSNIPQNFKSAFSIMENMSTTNDTQTGVFWPDWTQQASASVTNSTGCLLPSFQSDISEATLDNELLYGCSTSDQMQTLQLCAQFLCTGIDSANLTCDNIGNDDEAANDDNNKTSDPLIYATVDFWVSVIVALEVMRRLSDQVSVIGVSRSIMGESLLCGSDVQENNSIENLFIGVPTTLDDGTPVQTQNVGIKGIKGRNDSWSRFFLQWAEFGSELIGGIAILAVSDKSLSTPDGTTMLPLFLLGNAFFKVAKYMILNKENDVYYKDVTTDTASYTASQGSHFDDLLSNNRLSIDQINEYVRENPSHSQILSYGADNSVPSQKWLSAIPNNWFASEAAATAFKDNVKSVSCDWVKPTAKQFTPVISFGVFSGILVLLKDNDQLETNVALPLVFAMLTALARFVKYFRPPSLHDQLINRYNTFFTALKEVIQLNAPATDIEEGQNSIDDGSNNGSTQNDLSLARNTSGHNGVQREGCETSNGFFGNVSSGSGNSQSAENEADLELGDLPSIQRWFKVNEKNLLVTYDHLIKLKNVDYDLKSSQLDINVKRKIKKEFQIKLSKDVNKVDLKKMFVDHIKKVPNKFTPADKLEILTTLGITF